MAAISKQMKATQTVHRSGMVLVACITALLVVVMDSHSLLDGIIVVALVVTMHSMLHGVGTSNLTKAIMFAVAKERACQLADDIQCFTAATIDYNDVTTRVYCLHTQIAKLSKIISNAIKDEDSLS